MNYILYISILFSLVLPLSDEQIDKIKSKTDDVNYAPNFTLNSIEERDFSNIKNLLIAISNANILFRIEKGEYAKTVEELIYNSYLSMNSSISNRWIFEINSNSLSANLITNEAICLLSKRTFEPIKIKTKQKILSGSTMIVN